VIQYGSSVSAGNAKTRRHERRRKLAIERDAIGNIIDSILGCEAPDASQEESRKHASRVDRATSLVALRDKKPEVTERKRNPAYKKPVTVMLLTDCCGLQSGNHSARWRSAPVIDGRTNTGRRRSA
uniref:transcriptional antitermination N peptide n=1 Tax=Cronobacter sakazakii TaxID=28141 RepID=UPI0021580D5F